MPSGDVVVVLKMVKTVGFLGERKRSFVCEILADLGMVRTTLSNDRDPVG